MFLLKFPVERTFASAALNLHLLQNKIVAKRESCCYQTAQSFCSMDNVAMVISKIDPEDVAELIRKNSLIQEDVNGEVPFVIIDVRGDDYEGGHIRGSCNIPSHIFTEQPDVIDQLIERYTNGPVNTMLVTTLIPFYVSIIAIGYTVI